MKTRLRVATTMICLPLLALLVSTPQVLGFGAPGGNLSDGIGQRNPFEWEVAFSRAGIAAVGILIVIFPFRKSQFWAWSALALLLLVYMIPVFVLPVLVPFPGWHVFWNGIFNSGLPRIVFLNLLLSISMLAGLVLSFPGFPAKKSTDTRTQIVT